MGHPALRAAPWALLALFVLSALAAMPGAWAGSTPTYTLTGGVEQPVTFAPVPAGVTVDLVSQATHATYATQTQSAGGVPSGQFTFTAGNTGNTLSPGWWGVMVPPQSRLHLTGSNCNPCAILPANQTVSFHYYNSTALTTSLYPVTISNVQVLPYNGWIFGNASTGTGPAVNASVQLLDPTYAGFVLANATTNRTGSFNFSAPSGTWVLKTTLLSSPNSFAYQQVVLTGNRITVNPVISNVLVSGHVNQASSGGHVPNGGNATVIDTSNMSIFSYPVPPLGFYAVGGYPAGFTGPGAENFDVLLSVVGYGTMWFPLSVSGSGPSVPSPHDVAAPAIAPPASYSTTLDFSQCQCMGNVSVSTTATLGNYSTIPELPNASVGQLWAQLALDFNHSLNFSSTSLPSLYNWVQSEGPFFPAAQAGATVNGVSFGANNSFTFAPGSTCSGVCGLGSNANLSFGWTAKYNTTSTVSSTLKNYTLSFAFRHPTHAQSFNYTVKLPAGYVLSAGQAESAPAGSTLLPAGLGGTWTSFELVSKPYSSQYTTASFSIVKYGNVSAIVNVTAADFAFSHLNVLNDSRGNYTVVVGAGENVTFSGVNSTFPSGTNGTLYAWTFGDTHTASTSQPTTYHTYTTAGIYDGTLTLTSSGGSSSSTTFKVIVGSSTPTAVISTNATITNANGLNYTIVNWSQTLHFNASLSSSVLPAGAPAGILSVASWNVSSHGGYWRANYTASSGLKDPAGQNDSYTFSGAGLYLTSTTLNGQTVTFTGWQYNITLQLWDGGGHLATQKMVVLVRDTEKPAPVVTALDSRGHTIPSAGIVEGSNQTAEVQLSATNSSDPHNGSLTWYNWTVKNAANSSVNISYSQSALAGFKIPPRPAYWFHPESKPYTVNLTVTDRAGNTAYKTDSVSIQINVSQRPVLAVSNLTAPSSMNDGSTYTVWVNVTNTLGKNSTAQGVQVDFYLLPTSGSGSHIEIGGAPGSVQFYNYTTNTTIASSPFATGMAQLKYNVTVRAVISFNPGRQGTYDLWANATAVNEFNSSYGANTAHVQVTLNANPTTFYEEIAAIVAAVVVVIVAVVLYYRSRMRRGSSSGKSSSSKSGLERSKKDEDDDES